MQQFLQILAQTTVPTTLPSTLPVTPNGQLSQFFTWESLGTFGGASAAVLLLTNLVRKLLNKPPPALLAFVISLIISTTGAIHAGKLNDPEDWLILILNAALLFFSATGANESLANVPGIGATPMQKFEAHGRLPCASLIRSWYA